MLRGRRRCKTRRQEGQLWFLIYVRAVGSGVCGSSPAGEIGSGGRSGALLYGDALGQVPRVVDVAAQTMRNMIGKELDGDGAEDGASSRRIVGRISVWLAMRRMRSLSSSLMAMIGPRRAAISSIFASSFSCVQSRWMRKTDGVSSSISAIGPCFISPAAYPRQIDG